MSQEGDLPVKKNGSQSTIFIPLDERIPQSDETIGFDQFQQAEVARKATRNKKINDLRPISSSQRYPGS